MVLSISGNILSKISFCDKQCSNVNDNKTKSEIIDQIDNKYKLQVITKDYTILNPNIMRNISYHQHIISTYTIGNPYMLYLLKIDGINCCMYIDKKLNTGYSFPKMHCVKYRFDDSLFENETIFTGELIRDKERRWFFIIDNILIYKGMSTAEKNILSRFELIHNILKNEYTEDKYLEICPLQVKKLFLYKQIKQVFTDYIPSLSYLCKGLILYTLNNRHTNYAYIIQRDSQIQIKSNDEINEIVQELYPELWEKKNSICNVQQSQNQSQSQHDSDSFDNTNGNISPLSMQNYNNNGNGNGNDTDYNIGMNEYVGNQKDVNKDINNKSDGLPISLIKIHEDNIVFRILKTEIPDIYNLYYKNSDDNLVKHSIALVPNLKTSKFLYDTYKKNPNSINMNAECKYSKVFEKWTPLRFLTDATPYTQSQVETIENRIKNE
jgi:hypothetical protein